MRLHSIKFPAIFAPFNAFCYETQDLPFHATYARQSRLHRGCRLGTLLGALSHNSRACVGFFVVGQPLCGEQRSKFCVYTGQWSGRFFCHTRASISCPAAVPVDFICAVFRLPAIGTQCCQLQNIRICRLWVAHSGPSLQSDLLPHFAHVTGMSPIIFKKLHRLFLVKSDHILHLLRR